jgi:putative copper resistance protein D
VLHLTGVGTWLGGLFMLAVLLIGREAVDLRAVLSRFSGIGYGLVALIVITGMINVRALSGGLWPEPALSGFGLVLAVKLAIVLGMLALAATNRALSRARHLRMPVLRTCVVLECLLGGAALAAVSLLGTLPPILT